MDGASTAPNRDIEIPGSVPGWRRPFWFGAAASLVAGAVVGGVLVIDKRLAAIEHPAQFPHDRFWLLLGCNVVLIEAAFVPLTGVRPDRVIMEWVTSVSGGIAAGLLLANVAAGLGAVQGIAVEWRALLAQTVAIAFSMALAARWFRKESRRRMVQTAFRARSWAFYAVWCVSVAAILVDLLGPNGLVERAVGLAGGLGFFVGMFGAMRGGKFEWQEDPSLIVWMRFRNPRSDILGSSSRVSSATLEAVSAALEPQEQIIGACPINLASFVECSFTVTDRNVYLASSKERAAWKAVRNSAPEKFRVGKIVIRLPLEAVVQCRLADDVFTIELAGEPAMTFKVQAKLAQQWGDDDRANLLLQAARLDAPEHVIGANQMSIGTWEDCTLKVTDRNVYLFSGWESDAWRAVRNSAPEKFRVGRIVVRLPLETVIECRLADDLFTIELNREPAITFKVDAKQAHKWADADRANLLLQKARNDTAPDSGGAPVMPDDKHANPTPTR